MTAYFRPLLLLLLISCGRKQEVTSQQLEQVILADKRSSIPICHQINTKGVDRLPAKFQLSAAQDAFFGDFRVLEKHGYVTVDEVKTIDPFGGAQIKVWEVKLTPRWDTDFGHVLGGERCVGHWKAQGLKTFTPPVETDGVLTTSVTVSGSQAYEGWASKPELQDLFQLPPLAAHEDHTYTLTRKGQVWEVIDVNRQ